jgi:phenylalanyl-tRNA synthetase alpha chain
MSYAVPKRTDFSATSLDSAVRELLSALEQESAAVASENDWKFFRDRWMARKNGVLTQLNDLWLKAAPKDAKRDVGQRVNELKNKVERVVEGTLNRIQGGASTASLASERVDDSTRHSSPARCRASCDQDDERDRRCLRQPGLFH